jgi:predicted GIY-YIG superfamily endonuclease
MLGLLKYDLKLKVLGFYSMQCECGIMYIGQISWAIETRYKEHTRHTRIGMQHKNKTKIMSVFSFYNIKKNHLTALIWDEKLVDVIQIHENLNSYLQKVCMKVI